LRVPRFPGVFGEAEHDQSGAHQRRRLIHKRSMPRPANVTGWLRDTFAVGWKFT
jgi:hypothetical protein